MVLKNNFRPSTQHSQYEPGSYLLFCFFFRGPIDSQCFAYVRNYSEPLLTHMLMSKVAHANSRQLFPCLAIRHTCLHLAFKTFEPNMAAKHHKTNIEVYSKFALSKLFYSKCSSKFKCDFATICTNLSLSLSLLSNFKSARSSKKNKNTIKV